MNVKVALAKLVVFTLFSVVVLVTMWNTLSNSTSGDTTEVTAMFSDASGLRTGDSVRIAGVKVGRVESVELNGVNARVTMAIDDEHPVMSDTRFLIRYENLLGRRYVSLRPGDGGDDRVVQDGVVPLSRTEPAFDISVLVNGFQPVFDLLSKDDINELAETLVKVLQGEGATVEDLLVHASRVTTNVAAHDEAIGEVITNLSAVLEHLEANDGEFADLVGQVSRMIAGLTKNSDVITTTIADVDAMTTAVNDLLTEFRPQIRTAVIKGRKVLQIYAREGELLDDLLRTLPDFLRRPTRASQHGAWLTLYPCEIKTTPLLPVDVFGTLGHQHSEVCR